MYRSANSGTVIQSKEEMPWARSVRSAGEKQILTECDAVWFGRTLPIFSLSLLRPFSWNKIEAASCC